MKKTLLLSVVLICSFSRAQENFIPADSLSNWSGRGIIPAANMTWWMQFFTQAEDYDTLIAGENYSKLYHTFGDDVAYYYCGFRADVDEKALYVIPKDSSEEFMFFDFDAPYVVNDTITLTYNRSGLIGEEWLTGEFILVEIDSINMDGEYYKRWNFEGLPDFDPKYLNITERIISTSFPFTISFFFETTLDLKCYSENDVPLYGTWCPFSEADFDATMNVQEFEGVTPFSIYPNPNTGDFVIANLGNEKGSIAIYNLLGEEVFSSEIGANPQQTIQQKGNLKPGTYLAVFTNKTGVFSQKMVVN